MNRPVLFLWTPKTAGTTIWWQLEWRSCQRAQRLPVDSFDPTVPFTTFQHIPMQTVVNCGVVSREWIRGAFKIGVVRNPWEWLVSIYHGLKKMGPEWDEAEVLGRTFGEYVRYVVSDQYPRPIQDRMVDAPYASPQATWLTLDGFLRADLILVYENLADGWTMLRETLGFGDEVLPRINESEHSHYSRYYTPDTRKLVADHYAAEIATFNYEFEEA